MCCVLVITTSKFYSRLFFYSTLCKAFRATLVAHPNALDNIPFFVIRKHFPHTNATTLIPFRPVAPNPYWPIIGTRLPRAGSCTFPLSRRAFAPAFKPGCFHYRSNDSHLQEVIHSSIDVPSLCALSLHHRSGSPFGVTIRSFFSALRIRNCPSWNIFIHVYFPSPLSKPVENRGPAKLDNQEHTSRAHYQLTATATFARHFLGGRSPLQSS